MDWLPLSRIGIVRSVMASDRRGQGSENWDHWIRGLMTKISGRKQHGGVRIEGLVEKEVSCGLDTNSCIEWPCLQQIRWRIQMEDAGWHDGKDVL